MKLSKPESDACHDRWPRSLPKAARLIATHSAPVRIVRRVWFGKDLERPMYHIAGTLFLRMLGLVYLIAFVSLWTQICGLVGDQVWNIPSLL